MFSLAFWTKIGKWFLSPAGLKLLAAIGAALLLWWAYSTIETRGYNRGVAEYAPKLETQKEITRRVKGIAQDWAARAGYLDGLLEHANRENARVLKEGRQAVARAERARLAAEKRAKDFSRRFAQRTPSCKQALATMEASCTELSDY